MSLEVTPVQSNNGITSNDVAITAGAAAVGALGGGAMYFKTPAEDAFVKSGLKLENKALEKYLKKYKVKNSAKFFRETIMKTILSQFDQDYPTLFDVPPVYNNNSNK